MRFAMITTFYPPFSYGGDATYVRALAKGLAERGHEVHVIASTDAYTLRSTPPLCIDEPSDGVHIHRLHAGTPRLAPLYVQQTSRPGPYRSEIAQILDQPFDVIHYHNISLVGGLGVLDMGTARVRLYTTHEHWLFCAAHILWKNRRKRCDRPTCVTCSLRSGIPPQIWRFGSRRSVALRNIDRILSPSRFTAELHRKAGIDQDIEILPLFSALPAGIHEDASNEHTKRPRFIFVGRVTQSKGIDLFLQAARELPTFDFEVIGEGDRLDLLRAQHDGDQNVRFLGRIAQSELIAHYRQATALVFPSLAPETFGLAIVEAAQCGTPAIVDAMAGGAAEVVDNSGGGLLYHDFAGLVRAISSLARDGSLRERLGNLARKSFEQSYTVNKHFDRYLGLVERLLASKRYERSGTCVQS